MGKEESAGIHIGRMRGYNMPFAQLYLTLDGAVRDALESEPFNVIGGWSKNGATNTLFVHIHQDGGLGYMHHLSTYRAKLTRGGEERLKYLASGQGEWSTQDDVLAILAEEYVTVEENTLRGLAEVMGADCSGMELFVTFVPLRAESYIAPSVEPIVLENEQYGVLSEEVCLDVLSLLAV